MFLRNYILSEGWLEKNKNKFDNRQFLQIDKSDEENDSKFDEFENKFKTKIIYWSEINTKKNMRIANGSIAEE